MISEIVLGLKTVAEAFAGLKKLRKERADKIGREEFIKLYVRALDLLRAGHHALKLGRISVVTLDSRAFLAFGEKLVAFRSAFERLGHNPDWDATESESLFDVLHIYIPDFINHYFTALRYSSDYFSSTPLLALYQYLHRERRVWPYELHLSDTESTQIRTDQDLLGRLSTDQRRELSSMLTGFLDEVAESLQSLETSLADLGNFLRDRYKVHDVASIVKRQRDA